MNLCRVRSAESGILPFIPLAFIPVHNRQPISGTPKWHFHNSGKDFGILSWPAKLDLTTKKYMTTATNSTSDLTLLSTLLLGAAGNDRLERIRLIASNYNDADLVRLWTLGMSNHVILRGFPDLHRVLVAKGSDHAEWVENAMATERARIQHALNCLVPICQALEEAGDVIVIKSLDHWPDLGSDLDLYTTAEGPDVVAIMSQRFQARLAERSWGDKLAHKWNFVVPGLPELIEVHAGRLGQTGEQVAITNSLVSRARPVQFGKHTFRVPRPEDRIIISTLQRMYRHFYLRLCDVAQIARLVDSDSLDYDYLRSLARSAGLWEGLATYLAIVGDYVEKFRGENLALPYSVTNAAKFGGDNIRFKQQFLRIPIFPQAAGLYAKEWMKLLSNGELQNTLRLSLLPGLAVAAAVAFKMTGNDKGIW